MLLKFCKGLLLKAGASGDLLVRKSYMLTIRSRILNECDFGPQMEHSRKLFFKIRIVGHFVVLAKTPTKS